MRVIGVLPMAGTGSRLALPFPKPLLPTWSGDQLVPLYWHAYTRLSRITNEIVHVVSPRGSLDPCLASVPGEAIIKRELGEAPSSIAAAAHRFPGTWLAVCLPDTIWQPMSGMCQLAAAVRRDEDCDGGLLTFSGRADVLDEVIVEGGRVRLVVRKQAGAEGPVRGWGAFMVKSDLAAYWDDMEALADNLGRLTLTAVHADGEYLDLGTPERYREYMRR